MSSPSGRASPAPMANPTATRYTVASMSVSSSPENIQASRPPAPES